VIFYGKSGEFATNRRDQHQLGMLALNILQAGLVYVNLLVSQTLPSHRV
jgi:TnpA family transposase